MDQQSKIILISGPTASGKSNFAVKIAKKIDGEIINADSMQVYKKLKILTARPKKKEEKNIRHHMYGVIDLNKKFSAGQWLKITIKKIKEIKSRKKIPILVGGTGLYFQSLINGLVKIPEIPLKFRNKIRLIHKKIGQNKFYKKLIKIDPNVKDKFDPNDTQRTIRAFEIKSFTKVSMYDWLKKTRSEFDDNDFLKLYIDFKREDLMRFRCENFDESKDEVPLLQIITALDIQHARLLFTDFLRVMNIPIMTTQIVKEEYYYSKLHDKVFP